MIPSECKQIKREKQPRGLNVDSAEKPLMICIGAIKNEGVLAIFMGFSAEPTFNFTPDNHPTWYLSGTEGLDTAGVRLKARLKEANNLDF